jgi:hypothetical protein
LPASIDTLLSQLELEEFLLQRRNLIIEFCHGQFSHGSVSEGT